MSSYLLDTHAVVWLMDADVRLGVEARRLANTALRENGLLVSAMTFWEVAMLAKRQRVALGMAIPQWRHHIFELGVIEVPISGDIGILANDLEGLPADPADRIITATALQQGATLVTADTGLLGWDSDLPRHDARK